MRTAFRTHRRVAAQSNKRPGADAGWRVLFAFGSPRPRAAQAERWPIMQHVLALVVVGLIAAGCSSSHERGAASLPAKTQTAMSQLHAGMTEAAAVALMKPVVLDSGRVTWGGTGRGRVYFQVSQTQQFYAEVGPGPGFEITRIGNLEPKQKWIRDGLGGMSVQ